MSQKRSNKMEGLQRATKISKNIQKYQRHPKHPRDTQRYPIISKTSKATPERPKEPKILCEIYNYLSWPQRKGAFPDVIKIWKSY